VQRIAERHGNSRLSATRRVLNCCVNSTNPPVEIGEEFALDKQPCLDFRSPIGGHHLNRKLALEMCAGPEPRHAPRRSKP
jgi:hypothetical protein